MYFNLTLKKIKLTEVSGQYEQAKIYNEYTAADDPKSGVNEFSKTGNMLQEKINKRPPANAP